MKTKPILYQDTFRLHAIRTRLGTNICFEDDCYQYTQKYTFK